MYIYIYIYIYIYTYLCGLVHFLLDYFGNNKCMNVCTQTNAHKKTETYPHVPIHQNLLVECRSERIKQILCMYAHKQTHIRTPKHTRMYTYITTYW